MNLCPPPEGMVLSRFDLKSGKDFDHSQSDYQYNIEDFN